MKSAQIMTCGKEPHHMAQQRMKYYLKHTKTDTYFFSAEKIYRTAGLTYSKLAQTHITSNTHTLHAHTNKNIR